MCGSPAATARQAWRHEHGTLSQRPHTRPRNFTCLHGVVSNKQTKRKVSTPVTDMEHVNTLSENIIQAKQLEDASAKELERRDAVIWYGGLFSKLFLMGLFQGLVSVKMTEIFLAWVPASSGCHCECQADRFKSHFFFFFYIFLVASGRNRSSQRDRGEERGRDGDGKAERDRKSKWLDERV